eukprot:8636539-Pyramimonas_sp.AAC.1
MTEAPTASPATQGFWTRNLMNCDPNVERQISTTDDDRWPCSLSMVKVGESREAPWNRAQLLM